MERLRATPESYARKIEFLRTAMAEKAHEKFPNVRNLTEDSWVKIKNIGAVYNGSSNATLQSIGDQYGVTAERIRVYCKEFIEYIHGNCSKKTQNRFPLDTIPFDKPVNKQQLGERISRTKSGLSLRIRKLLESGVTKRSEIAENLHVSLDQVSKCLRILRGWGEKLAKRKSQSYQELKEEIEKETDEKELQRKLDSLPAGSVIGFANRFGDSKQAIFMYFGNALRKLGYDSKSFQFAQILRELNIPSRYIKGCVFYAKHEKRVRDAIWTTIVIENNRLKRVDPAIYDIRKNKEYEKVDNFIYEITSWWKQDGLKMEDFLLNCSVPIFKDEEGYFFYSGKKSTFKAFIEKKFEQIYNAFAKP